MAKVPRRPPKPLTVDEGEVVAYRGAVWRIQRTSGARVSAWNEARTFGPLPTMRFDPHLDEPTGPRSHPGDGVLYAATDIATCVAEVYQTTKVVDRHSGAPVLVGWTPVRPMRLLDLTGSWALRNGAAQSLAAAPRAVCRAWAREIYSQLPELDGLWVPSTMTGASNVVMWLRAADSMPAGPSFVRELSHPIAQVALASACRRIGYRIL